MGCLCPQIALANTDLRRIGAGQGHLATASGQVAGIAAALVALANLTEESVFSRTIAQTAAEIAGLSSGLQRGVAASQNSATAAHQHVSNLLRTWVPADRAHHAAVAAAAAAAAASR